MERPAEATSREELRSKRISTEEMVRLQLDRINLIRSNVKDPDRVAAWSEAVEALADLVMPWATEPDEKDRFVKEWDDRPVAVVRIPLPAGESRLVPVPNASDCREAQRILMGLLDRKGLLVKRRTVSGPAKRDFKPADDEPEPQVPM